MSMLPVAFEPTISAGERPQTYALERAATGTGNSELIFVQNYIELNPKYTLHLIGSYLDYHS